jgi:hypothetical protein
MAARILPIPSGGTLQVPIPDGFGLAASAPSTQPFSRYWPIAACAGIGALVGLLITWRLGCKSGS